MNRFSPFAFVSRAHFVAAGACILILLPACNENSTGPAKHPSPPTGALITTTGCKTGALGLRSGYQSDQDCIVWEYHGNGTLTLTHVNAGLNCCPGTIEAEIAISGSEITIAEREGEDSHPCRCLCLYDLGYAFTCIAAGPITFTFIEQYLPDGAEALTVTVDLSLEPAGSHCVARDTYPWGSEYAQIDPIGIAEGHSSCKDFPAEYLDGDSEIPPLDDPSKACIFLRYDAARGHLSLTHHNAGFNCCVDTIGADFTFTPGTIEITEREEPAGGICDCSCLYDVRFAIANLDPGVYTIKIVEPYLPPGNAPLEFTVDLATTTQYLHCVSRSGYPWGAGSDEDHDKLILRRLYAAIVAYIGTPYCDHGDDCRSVAVGAKPCGGPWEYLIYSAATLDEETLHKLVAAHEGFERYMNERYGYASTCDTPSIPTTECLEGICRAVRP